MRGDGFTNITQNGLLVQAGGMTVSAGHIVTDAGATISAGGLKVDLGGLTILVCYFECRLLSTASSSVCFLRMADSSFLIMARC